MINGFCSSFLSMCSNLLEKTTDAVIKSAKNGDLSLVSFFFSFELVCGFPI